MRILDEIATRLEAHNLIAGNKIQPTIYAGTTQMMQIKAACIRYQRVGSSGELGQPMLLGMPLVEVVADDYLRVA